MMEKKGNGRNRCRVEPLRAFCEGRFRPGGRGGDSPRDETRLAWLNPERDSAPMPLVDSPRRWWGGVPSGKVNLFAFGRWGLFRMVWKGRKGEMIRPGSLQGRPAQAGRHSKIGCRLEAEAMACNNSPGCGGSSSRACPPSLRNSYALSGSTSSPTRMTGMPGAR